MRLNITVFISMPNNFLKYYMDLLSPLGSITSHSMFGGFGLFSDKTVFAFVAKERLCIRANESQKKVFEKRGFQPFSYTKRTGRVVTSYYILPNDVLKDRNQLLQLAKGALNDSQNRGLSKRLSFPVKLRVLPNFQASTERMLRKAGIDSVECLYRVGAANAFLAIRASHNVPVKLELLWILEGAIQGVHWSVVSNQRRNELIHLIETV